MDDHRCDEAETLGPDHNTCFASLVLSADGEVVVGLSNNTWGDHRSDVYPPTFASLPPSHGNCHAHLLRL